MSVLSRKLASRRKRDDQSTIGQLRSDYTLRIIRWLLPQCCLLLQATLWHSKQLSIIFSPYSNCHTIRCIHTLGKDFRHCCYLCTYAVLAFAERCKEMLANTKLQRKLLSWHIALFYGNCCDSRVNFDFWLALGFRIRIHTIYLQKDFLLWMDCR